MLRKLLPISIIVLMLFSTIPIDVDSEHLSENNSTIMPSSSPVRIQITSPTYIMSADEVVTF